MNDSNQDIFRHGIVIAPADPASSEMSITIKLLDDERIMLKNDDAELTLSLDQAAIAALAMLTIVPEDLLPDMDDQPSVPEPESACSTGQCGIDFDDPLN